MAANFSRNYIEDLTDIKECWLPSLLMLNLSHNKIDFSPTTTVDIGSTCPNITALDLSNNLISTMDGFDVMQSQRLSLLQLSGNLLAKPHEEMMLSACRTSSITVSMVAPQEKNRFVLETFLQVFYITQHHLMKIDNASDFLIDKKCTCILMWYFHAYKFRTWLGLIFRSLVTYYYVPNPVMLVRRYCVVFIWRHRYAEKLFNVLQSYVVGKKTFPLISYLIIIASIWNNLMKFCIGRGTW